MLSYLYSSLMARANDFSMEGAEGGGRGGESVSGKQSAFYVPKRSEGEFGITPLYLGRG